jgi:hypothetical protein
VLIAVKNTIGSRILHWFGRNGLDLMTGGLPSIDGMIVPRGVPGIAGAWIACIGTGILA